MLSVTQAPSLKQEYTIINEMVDILVILIFFINAHCYHIYNIPIGFSDLEYVGVDTKCVFYDDQRLRFKFLEDIDCGRFW